MADPTAAERAREVIRENLDWLGAGTNMASRDAVDALLAHPDLLAALAVEAGGEAKQIDIDVVAEWLVAIGYGFDYSTDTPLPEPLRRPFAEAWWRHEGRPTEPTVDDYYDLLAEECRWPKEGASDE